jgi:hypothetical protein
MATLTVDRAVDRDVAALIRSTLSEIDLAWQAVEVYPSPIGDAEVWVSAMNVRRRLTAALNRLGCTVAEIDKTLIVKVPR